MAQHGDDLEVATSPTSGGDELYVVHATGSTSVRHFVSIGLTAGLLAVVLLVLAWPHGSGASGKAGGGAPHTRVGVSFNSVITIDTAAPQTPQTPFPAFGQWRAVYLADDNRLHAVSLSGRIETSGLTISDLRGSLGANLGRVAISPDGRLLAYSKSTQHSSGALMVAALDTPSQPVAVPGTNTTFARELAWSPDSGALAYLDNPNLYTNAVYVVQQPFVHAPTLVPSVNWGVGGIASLVGWLDTSHVLIETGDAHLATLDIASGDLTIIAAVPSSNAQVVLSPDRATAFVATPDGSPRAEVIDLASGQISVLPRIGGALPATLLTYAWQPQSQLLAVTATDPSGAGAPASALLDLGADTSTPLDGSGWVWGWTPDGTTLVVGTPLVVATPGQAPSLTGLRVGPDGTVLGQISLTNTAIGFVGFTK